jgi:hypothetical protein
MSGLAWGKGRRLEQPERLERLERLEPPVARRQKIRR